MQHGEGDDGGGNGLRMGIAGTGNVAVNISWMVDEGQQAATMTMEDEAQHASMLLWRRGGC